MNTMDVIQENHAKVGALALSYGSDQFHLEYDTGYQGIASWSVIIRVDEECFVGWAHDIDRALDSCRSKLVKYFERKVCPTCGTKVDPAVLAASIHDRQELEAAKEDGAKI